jgi:hypothetical protein
MTPTLRDLAEDAFAYLPGPQVELEHRQEMVLRNMPGSNAFFGMVLRPRLDDIDAALSTARAWFAARGRAQYVWAVADASLPADLAGRLAERGLEPEEIDPVYVGMTLEREPDIERATSCTRASRAVTTSSLSWTARSSEAVAPATPMQGCI